MLSRVVLNRVLPASPTGGGSRFETGREPPVYNTATVRISCSVCGDYGFRQGVGQVGDQVRADPGVGQEHDRLQVAGALVLQRGVLGPVGGHHVRVEVEPGQVFEEHKQQVRGEPGPERHPYLLHQVAQLSVRQSLRLQRLARDPGRGGSQHLGHLDAPPGPQRPEPHAHLVAERQVQQRKYGAHVPVTGEPRGVRSNRALVSGRIALGCEKRVMVGLHSV